MTEIELSYFKYFLFDYLRTQPVKRFGLLYISHLFVLCPYFDQSKVLPLETKGLHYSKMLKAQICSLSDFQFY